MGDFELQLGDAQPFGIYHDPDTGKEYRLPCDPYSIEHYTSQRSNKRSEQTPSFGSNGRKRRLVFGPAPKTGTAPAPTQLKIEDLSSNEALVELLRSMQNEMQDLRKQLAENEGEARTDEPVQPRLFN
jgi:hypothetical protein